MTPEELDRIRSAANARTEAIAELATRICEVPAPTGNEAERAQFVASLLRDRGYDAEIDEVNNVYARRGSRGGPVVMLLAHIDTVFPAGTPIKVRREGDMLHAPGIGDNSTNVAGMITTLDVLDELGIETSVDLIACADVGEEGLGNLRGARAAVERYRDQLGAVIVLDGRQGHITNVGVGSKRWRVTVTGPGGHSFSAFGVPSAIHGLGRIIAQIDEIEAPSEPKTTYNIGIISGGTSINSIAAEATALLDMRSTDPEALDRLSEQAREIITRAPGDGLESKIEVLGERPAGRRDADDSLVRLTADVIRWLGHEPELQAASTDANIPMSYNIPTVVIGISRAERGHTLNEYVEVSPMGLGVAGVVRLVIEAADWVAKN